MLPSEYFVESCTLFDDQYLAYQDLVEHRPHGEIESKSQLNAGGFSYTIKNDYRFIIWRINGNQLELIEQSLVYKLNENCKRIIFQNSMIIPRIHIAKDFSDSNFPIIQILIATTFKLYRLSFKVPLNDFTTKSILYNFNSSDLSNIDTNNSCDITLQQVDYGNIFVTPVGEAIFSFILPNNSISCVRMSPINKKKLFDMNRSVAHAQSNQNLPVRFELNQPSIVSRLWSGISRATQDSQPVIISYKLFYLNETTYLIGLCKDSKIRIFCLKTNQCICVEELVKYVKLDNAVIWEESILDIVTFANNAIFSVVLSSTNEFKVCNLNIEMAGGANIRISEVSKRNVRKKGKLVNVYLTNSKVWLMYKNEKESIEIVTIAIDQNNMSVVYLEESNLNGQEKIRRMNTKKFDSGEMSDDEDEDADFICDSSLIDIKEKYLKLIFEPYQFSRTNIFKALGVLTNSSFDQSKLPKTTEELKRIIIQSIESEASNQLGLENLTEEEFLYVNSKYWLKFYTMLKQYDYDSRLPVGLFVDPENETLITLIRKNAISVYNNADLSEYTGVSVVESVRTYLIRHSIHVDDDHQSSDLLHMINCIQNLTSSLKLMKIASDSIESSEVDISNCHSINELKESLISSDKNILSDISIHLNKISNQVNIVRTLQMIIAIFDRDLKECDVDWNQSENMDIEENLGSSQYLGSEFTINFVLSNFYHRVIKRYEFLKSLTILLNIICRYYENLDMPRELADEINIKYFETILSYLNGYEYLKWINSIYPSFVSKQELDKNARRIMDLVDPFYAEENLSEMKNTARYDNFLVKSYILSFRNKKIFDVNTIASINKNLMRFNEISDYLTINVFKTMWPSYVSNDDLALVKYLLNNGQYIHLNNYCLATRWLPKGKSLRFFLLANSCLFFNNIDQSIDLFLKASHFINNDLLLKKLMKIAGCVELPLDDNDRRSTMMPNNSSNRRKSINITKSSSYQSKVADSSLIFNNTSNIEIFDKLVADQSISRADEALIDSSDKLLLDYYIKIIHYYDLNGDIEAAIELVQNALLKFQFDAKSKSTLYCILFKSYMSLEYYEKAHASIVSNLDLEWKLICLKHFISELCNQNKTSKLVSFDYGDLHQDVLNILHERANISDLRTHDYYNIIYSLRLKHKDYLKAASCMYECATRLKKEVHGLNSLKRQEKCYLACLNVLKLVDKKYAWIIRPDDQVKTQKTALRSLQNKEGIDCNENLDVVDIEEINKKYMATYYMIKLASINQNQTNTVNFYNTDEIISLLIKLGLFDDALIAASLFKTCTNPMGAVLIGLVERICQENKEKDIFQSEYDFSKNNDSIECYSPYENPTDFKWRLLISYLTKYNNTEYYKVVCKHLIKNGYEIPDSISYLFKKLDPNALLKVYIDFNFWEECVEIISEQIDMFIRKDKQISSQDDSSKLITLSFNNVDKILYVLAKSGRAVSDKRSDLQLKLKEYLSQIKIASESMVRVKCA